MVKITDKDYKKSITTTLNSENKKINSRNKRLF